MSKLSILLLLSSHEYYKVLDEYIVIRINFSGVDVREVIQDPLCYTHIISPTIESIILSISRSARTFYSKVTFN